MTSDRVVLQSSSSLTLRRATYSDCELLWTWVNEPDVRAASFTLAAIPLGQHRKWFAKRLGSAACDILIAVGKNAEPVGVIRFDSDGRQNLVVSITVCAAHRGAGYGSRIIRRACTMLRTRRHVGNFIADIKSANVASQMVFKRAGFRKLRSIQKNGVSAIRMVSK